MKEICMTFTASLSDAFVDLCAAINKNRFFSCIKNVAPDASLCPEQTLEKEVQIREIILILNSDFCIDLTK